MRSVIAFACEGETLLGTLDAAAGDTGVLIVSGGNEVRSGTHRGMAMLAAALAAAGVPVFRYDRRGVGDSAGANGGWESSAPDLAAAAAAFRAAQPQVGRLVGFGNCDAATALALFGSGAGVDALVLANPWLGDDDPLPPPAVIRARYAERLRDPAAWSRLLQGGIDFRKAVNGLRRAARPSPKPPLASRMAAALTGMPVTLVLARGDRTAQIFAESWRSEAFASVMSRAQVLELETASHSFVGHMEALKQAILIAVHLPSSPRP